MWSPGARIAMNHLALAARNALRRCIRAKEMMMMTPSCVVVWSEFAGHVLLRYRLQSRLIPHSIWLHDRGDVTKTCTLDDDSLYKDGWDFQACVSFEWVASHIIVPTPCLFSLKNFLQRVLKEGRCVRTIICLLARMRLRVVFRRCSETFPFMLSTSQRASSHSKQPTVRFYQWLHFLSS